MSSDNFILSLLSQLMWSVPTLLVCIIGIGILRVRPIPNKAKNFGSAGLALVAFGAIASVAFRYFISAGGIDYSSGNFRFFQMGYSAIMQILHAVSLIFLIIAICSKDNTATLENETQHPYS